MPAKRMSTRVIIERSIAGMARSYTMKKIRGQLPFMEKDQDSYMRSPWPPEQG